MKDSDPGLVDRAMASAQYDMRLAFEYARIGDHDKYGLPIEIELAKALYLRFLLDDQEDYLFTGTAPTATDAQCKDGLLAFKQYRSVTVPQVTIGRYKVDFFVAVNLAPADPGGIVVECDGHEFHERTKAQAAHDKKRDRFLQMRGYQVLRFTGSEIWRNPYEAASEVSEAIFELQGRAQMAEHAVRRQPEPATDESRGG